MPKYPTNAKLDPASPPSRPGSPSGSQGRPPAANDNRPGPMEIKLPPLTRPQVEAAADIVGMLGPVGRAFKFGWDIGNFAFPSGLKVPPAVRRFPQKYWRYVDYNCNPRRSSSCVGTTGYVSCVGLISGSPPGAGHCAGAAGPSAGPFFDNHYSTAMLPGWSTPRHLIYTMGQWVRVAGAPNPSPVEGVSPVAPSLLADPRPAPIVWPIAVPTPVFRPAPARKPDPLEEPAKQPDRPRPNSPNAPGYPVYDLPPGLPPLIRVPPPEISGIIVAPPTVTIDIGVGGISIGHRPGRPVKEPPGEKKQDKTNVATVGGIVWTGINNVTEFYDFTVAMYDALPADKALPGKPSKTDKLQYMLGNPSMFLEANVSEAIENLINNYVGDIVAAVGSDAIKKVYKEMGGITGLDRALREANVNGDNLGDFIPELDINLEQGTVSLVWK